ncbi:CRE-7TM GPCR protein [Aphelenchoides avenae]|nr:CRE-7TM GPCR protein [Aphelenchus avenae]
MLPVQYYYRFYLIAKGRPPSTKVLVRLLLIVIVTGTVNGILCFLSFYSTSLRGIDYSYILEDPMWTESDGRLATFLAADITSWEMLTYFSYAMVLVVGSYALALYYVVITYKAISNNARHFSEKTKRLQKQLSFTLFVQTVAPFFAISLPCLFIMLQAFFKLDMSGYGCLFSLPMFWIYVINPGSTILLVGQYRTAVFCQRTSGAVHTSSNTPPHKGVI